MWWEWKGHFTIIENDKHAIVDCVEKDGALYVVVPPKWRQDIDVAIAACRSNIWILIDVCFRFRDDHESLIGLICGLCSTDVDTDSVFDIFFSFRGDPCLTNMNDDKEIMLRLAERFGWEALKHASKRLQANKEVAIAACHCHGASIIHVSRELWTDKEVVQAACSNYPLALSYIARNYRTILPDDTTGELPTISTPESDFNELFNNKEVILMACSTIEGRGDMLQYATKNIRNDKEVVMTICKRDGNALQYASDNLRADKDIILAAVTTTPISLKYALGGLNQDKDCLIAAGIWDNEYHREFKKDHGGGNEKSAMTTRSQNSSCTRDPSVGTQLPSQLPSPTANFTGQKTKLVLSTRFSLNEKSTSQATHFTIELKKNSYVRENFVVYSPNAYSKSTCDPNWTDLEWPCRGTCDTCRMDDHFKPPWENDNENPADASTMTSLLLSGGCCWRYSFRWQLETAKKCGGAMIQFVDYDADNSRHVLGNGQKIETEMARAAGIKIFKFFSGRWRNSIRFLHMRQLIEALKECPQTQEANLDHVIGSEINIYPGRKGCDCSMCLG